MIDIPGIKIIHEVIDLEDSTDQSHTITIKDGYGKEIVINISFGKIL